jgi:hypothetical protein
MPKRLSIFAKKIETHSCNVRQDVKYTRWTRDASFVTDSQGVLRADIALVQKKWLHILTT